MQTLKHFEELVAKANLGSVGEATVLVQQLMVGLREYYDEIDDGDDPVEQDEMIEGLKAALSEAPIFNVRDCMNSALGSAYARHGKGSLEVTAIQSLIDLL